MEENWTLPDVAPRPPERTLGFQKSPEESRCLLTADLELQMVNTLNTGLIRE